MVRKTRVTIVLILGFILVVGLASGLACCGSESTSPTPTPTSTPLPTEAPIQTPAITPTGTASPTSCQADGSWNNIPYMQGAYDQQQTSLGMTYLISISSTAVKDCYKVLMPADGWELMDEQTSLLTFRKLLYEFQGIPYYEFAGIAVAAEGNSTRVTLTQTLPQ